MGRLSGDTAERATNLLVMVSALGQEGHMQCKTGVRFTPKADVYPPPTGDKTLSLATPCLYGYPPDLQDAAVQNVLQQAEALSAEWAA